LNFTFKDHAHFDDTEKDYIRIILSKNSELKNLDKKRHTLDFSDLIRDLNDIADYSDAELTEEERKAIKDACGKFKVRAEDIKPNTSFSQAEYSELLKSTSKNMQSAHNYFHPNSSTNLASEKNYKDSETSLESSAMEVSRRREKSKSTYTLIDEKGKSRDVSCEEMADKMITSNSRKALMGEAEGGDVKFVYDMRNHKLSIKMVRNSDVLFRNGESIKCQNNQFTHNNPALDIYFKGDVTAHNRLSYNYLFRTEESTRNTYDKGEERGVTSPQPVIKTYIE
jgi:hypothetical protein